MKIKEKTFAIEIVCCSMTSWTAVLSLSSILSNSSIQQIPLSARTSDPPSLEKQMILINYILLI